ncbi:MAG: sensor histidine kinase [Longimicrobiales bacterium]
MADLIPPSSVTGPAAASAATSPGAGAGADSGAGPGSGAEAGEAEGARVSSREALRFLMRAGRALAGSLDYDETLRRVVKFAIPRVACFAAIDVLRSDGLLERVAYGHIDPERQSLLDMAAPFPPRVEGRLPVAQVLQEGRSMLIERLDALLEEERDALDDDVALIRRLRELGGKSVIIVPLTARDERIGLIAFGSTRTDRFYGHKDLNLAQELARTAALAIDNARLFRNAERAIRAREEVLSVVSHDLRNPVHRVSLAAELLLEGEQVDPAARSSVEIILRAAGEMNRLIEDLLDVSRIEAGMLSLSTRPVDVATLLRHLDEEFAPVAARQGVDWRVQAPDPAPTLELDEHRVRQALGNLIGNALKFTGSGGAVTVEAHALSERGVEIAVRDTGPGMAPEQLEHIFDPFWQAERGDRRGAGLGLAIARGIAAAHRGELHAESRPGQGSRFALRFGEPVPGSSRERESESSSYGFS